MAAALMVSAVVLVPLGMLVGAVVPRDFEGMLVLIMIVGLQTIADPGQALARMLPLWSTRELLTYGIEGTGDLEGAWMHAGGYGAGLLLLGVVLALMRLRRRRHLIPGPAITA